MEDTNMTLVALSIIAGLLYGIYWELLGIHDILKAKT
jgi:hypothetical protein